MTKPGFEGVEGWDKLDKVTDEVGKQRVFACEEHKEIETIRMEKATAYRSSRDPTGNTLARGDEIKFEGKRAMVLKVIPPNTLELAYRWECDVHPGVGTYYRIPRWWHLFWRHWIGL